MVLALEKENAVEAWRDAIGSTNPENAEEGTIRENFIQMYKMQCTGRIVMKMLKKKLPFSFWIVNFLSN